LVRARVRVRVSARVGVRVRARVGVLLAQREARGEHVGAARLAATQQPGSGLLRR
jgi:hypothetical protein